MKKASLMCAAIVVMWAGVSYGQVINDNWTGANNTAYNVVAS